MEVEWEEASRFGIMNVDDNDVITSFEEKPSEPKSNLASMGIYIFNWKLLKQALIDDYKNPESEYDFGKNIIPTLLSQGKKLQAYRFDGYWKDVGTVKSYWEANLDLIKEDNALDIYDKSWRINTSTKNLPPHYILETGHVENTLINEACYIAGCVKNSVLFDQVHVEEGALVENSVLLPGAVVKKGAKVYNCVIDQNNTVEEGQEIGSPEDDNVYLLSEGKLEAE